VNLFQRHADHARSVLLPDGAKVYLRPLRATDLTHAEEFFAQLSERSRYMRFMAPMPRLTDETLETLEAAMREARAAVVVAVFEHADRSEELVGGGRIVPAGRPRVCEFALTIVDSWQGRGLGHVLINELVALARRLGYRRIEGHVLTINSGMLMVAQHARMKLRVNADDPSVITVYRTLHPFGRV
jgi:RimJ/RimL family protein N-acetyltransferase